MTWFRNTRYGSLSGSHAQITHMMWRQSVHVIQKSGMQEIKRLWGRRCPCKRSWRHDPKTGWSEKISGRLLGRTAPKRLASDAG